jgi:hypothetical protein
MKHLAQINIGRMLHPKGDPRVAEFFDNLDRVNAAAERMPGFVWRLKDDSGNATDISAFDDPAMLLNMSVWETAETLEAFVWQTVHARFYRKREAWFEVLTEPHFAMWWIEADHIPTPQEGRERVEHLKQHGPSEHAFGWADLAGAKLWREARCA